MNRKEEKGIGKLLNGRIKDLLLIGVLGIALFYTAWSIFRKDPTENVENFSEWSENEIKVMRILNELDGVGEANVVVSETKEGVQGVVVMCEGANDFQVVMDVREAVSAALGIEQKAIKIYFKKE